MVGEGMGRWALPEVPSHRPVVRLQEHSTCFQFRSGRCYSGRDLAEVTQVGIGGGGGIPTIPGILRPHDSEPRQSSPDVRTEWDPRVIHPSVNAEGSPCLCPGSTSSSDDYVDL